MENQLLKEYTIIMYDGSCGFCNEYIQFILDRKPSEKLKFVSQQSKNGQQLIDQFNIKEYTTSIIVVENHQYYKKSTAIFKIMKQLGTSWKYLSYLQIIPTFISDFVYSVLSKYRYKLVRQHCRLISKEEQHFFL
ncbi:thiol-disulfide oxidoreductase DCC family protein [Kordia sp.]|uniref:thiol-disulfide oxidoreductase DCC family protein n=1 Tax=Kordia sp. TaxID=1965332 RepID=UPI003B5A4A15